MRLGSRPSFEYSKSTVIKTKLHVIVFAGQAETTGAYVWWFFSWTHSFHFGGKRDMFVYPICFLIARSVSIFAYMIFECPLGVPQLFRNYSQTVCKCLNCQWVCTHTCVNWRESYVVYLLGTAPEQTWRASSEVRFYCVNGKTNLGLELGSWMEQHFYIRLSCLVFKNLDWSLDQVCVDQQIPF